MRKLALFLTMVLITTLAVHAQVLDVPPNDYQNYRAITGGAQKATIDTVTPLNELIKRLEKPWQFVETGKMYWIGYTDDMYSIAAHNDDAISPLLNFIASAKNLHAKYGAVYTLHLIGINRKMAGRFIEYFTNRNARNALLYLLKDDDLGETIMSLLVRDPWQSDVPKLISALADDKSAWYITSGLNQYQLDDYPLDGPVPNKISKLRFPFPSANGFGPDDFQVKLNDAIDSIRSFNNPSINIDPQLFKIKNLWGSFQFGISGDADGKLSISGFLRLIVSQRFFDYGMIGSKINYYVDNNVLYFCAPEKAGNIVLKWWNKRSATYKDQFSKDSAILKKNLLRNPFGD